MDTRVIYTQLLSSIQFPPFLTMEYIATQPVVESPEQAAYDAVHTCPDIARVRPGETVALTAGSREVYDIVGILRGVIRAVREQGGVPFIVPAMGSHGGATAEGQVRVLEHFGITEEALGVEIRSSMETVLVGHTQDGYPVHLDRIANSADHIIPIGRVKPHTDFRGPVESGVMKMLAIGLGKQYGASLCHKLGFPNMGKSVWNFGSVILENCRVLMGLAVVENGEHRTARIEGIPAAQIRKREPELLAYAKSLMPRIPFDNLDVLLVSEIGKDISGAGMDPNVTGRSVTLGEFWPHAEKIGVFNITPVSDGNAAGIGNADAITSQMYRQIDRLPMYINSITCRDTGGARIPTVMDTQELVLRYLLYTCIRRKEAQDQPRIVWIQSTACLRRIYISEALAHEARQLKDFRVTCESRPLEINKDGELRFPE